jgi:hypothetical protein
MTIRRPPWLTALILLLSCLFWIVVITAACTWLLEAIAS